MSQTEGVIPTPCPSGFLHRNNPSGYRRHDSHNRRGDGSARVFLYPTLGDPLLQQGVANWSFSKTGFLFFSLVFSLLLVPLRPSFLFFFFYATPFPFLFFQVLATNQSVCKERVVKSAHKYPGLRSFFRFKEE